jgi:hypothetical protein
VTCTQPIIPNITTALPPTFSSTPLTVLFANRHRNLRTAFRKITGITRWTVYESATLDGTLKILESQPIGVLICGDLLHGAEWRNVHRELELRSGAPSFIVCADKPVVTLWADVLHRGGYTVLPLPLQRDEVLRICWLASVSRQSAIETAPRPTVIAAGCARPGSARPAIARFAAA